MNKQTFYNSILVFLLVFSFQYCVPPLNRSILDLSLLAGINLFKNFQNQKTISVLVEGLEGENFKIQIQGGPGGNELEIASNGQYQFPKNLKEGTPYSIQVIQPPIHPLQSCSIEPESGIAGEIPIHSIQCTTIGYPVRVVVRHLGPTNSGLVVSNNGENLTITQGGTHTFPSDVLIGNNYSVSILNVPFPHSCVFSSPNSGTISNSQVFIEINCLTPLSFIPNNFSYLSPYVPIRVIFSGPVDPQTIQIIPGTTLTTTNGPNFVYTLHQTHIPNDTLQIAPQSGHQWANGNHNFIFSIQATDGFPLATSNNQVFLNYTIPTEMRFVSANGNDSNNGLTPQTPMRNIQTAINSISSCSNLDCLILVEDGTYPATITGHDFITLTEGISLQGGYLPGTNFQQMNFNSLDTVITMPSPNPTCTSATLANPCRAIFAPSGITNATKFSGFRVESRSAAYTTALLADGSPEITYSRFIGGSPTGASGESSGLYIRNSNLKMQNSDAEGGSCVANNQVSIGILIHPNVSSQPEISQSKGMGGACNFTGGFSIGLRLSGSGSISLSDIYENLFEGGTHPTTTSGTTSVGVHVVNSSIGGSLSENTIRANRATYCYGVYKTSSGSFQVGTNGVATQIQIPECNQNAYGIFLENGSINIINNNITIGNVSSPTTATNAIGIYSGISSPGPLTITNNRIQLGSVTSSTIFPANQSGIHTLNSTINTITRNNIILGTTVQGSVSSKTVGIFSNSGSNIVNNIINGGNTPYQFIGIESNNGTNNLTIRFNTIRVATGNPPDSYALKIIGQSNIIQNNIFYLSLSNPETCIYASDPFTIASGSLRNNNFFNCPTKLYVHFNSKFYTDICPGFGPVLAGTLGEFNQNCALANILGNIASFQDNNELNPQLQAPNSPTMSPNNFIPSMLTPCSIAKSSLGIAGINVDYFGNSRPTTPNGPSMGAIQWNGTCQ